MVHGEPILVVSSENELPADDQVWGTGGWLPPEDREALDWLTLARLLGWGVTVARPAAFTDLQATAGLRWIIVACDPARLGEDFRACLASMVKAQPIALIARAGAADGAFAALAGTRRKSTTATGHSLTWMGPGAQRAWHCRKILEMEALEVLNGAVTWATLDGAPVIAARQLGCGRIVTLGFHPSRARDIDGAATALLKHLLIWGVLGPVAWLDLKSSLILRMDDPGGAQNVFSRQWSYPKLGEEQWMAIGNELKHRRGRLSIGYSAGWVDDGDASRGILTVAGQEPKRVAGSVYPSPEVSYRDCAGHAPGTVHDYQAEFRGIQTLRAAGLGDVELHGYTHMHPNTAEWATAPDRYEESAWYRELGKAAAPAVASRAPDEHPLALGIRAFRRYFGTSPTTLICPGDQWTVDVLGRALELGLLFVSSYYLALRHDDRFCWAQHICAPYLDLPEAAWFDSELPVVGYFHDREPVVAGVDWIKTWLDRWEAAGAKRLMDFRQLASITCRHFRLEERHDDLHLTVDNANAPPLVRPLTIMINSVGKRLPSCIGVSADERMLSLDVERLDQSLGSVVLPCDHS